MFKNVESHFVTYLALGGLCAYLAYDVFQAIPQELQANGETLFNPTIQEGTVLGLNAVASLAGLVGALMTAQKIGRKA